MGSLWQAGVQLPEFDAIKGDVKTDVLIIGGGMAGILCAYMLKGAGINCIVAEADRICGGVTQNTTAKITSQHGLVYDKLLRRFGKDQAQIYLQVNQAALEEFRRLCGGIECDFEEKDAYVYSLNGREKPEKELAALEKLGFHAELAEELPLPFPVDGAVKFSRQAQFDPLKFVSAIAGGLNISEHTTVRELMGTTAVTDGGKIKADKIIVATHFPFINKHGSYFLKMYQHRSYVCAFQNAPQLDGMYVDESKTGMSFRNYKDMLLIGGGGHRTGKKGDAWYAAQSLAKKYYPEATIKYRWATQDCMTLDAVPYVGRYSAGTRDMYVATGFNKWGMTSSMASAMLLSDMIQGKRSPAEELFSPSRTILRPQLALNAFEAVTNLLTPTAPRCPHLGCALKWNRQERSWDCPCHGSRFEEDGKLITGPATGDLKRSGREKAAQ